MSNGSLQGEIDELKRRIEALERSNPGPPNPQYAIGSIGVFFDGPRGNLKRSSFLIGKLIETRFDDEWPYFTLSENDDRISYKNFELISPKLIGELQTEGLL